MSHTLDRYDYTGQSVRMGTYSASATTETINTGLKKVYYFNAMSSEGSTSPYASTISGGDITITVANSDSGWWVAFGI